MSANAKNDPRQALRDSQVGFYLIYITLTAVGRSVQLWSRIPGTCGRSTLGFSFLASQALLLLFIEVHVSSLRTLDAVPVTTLIGVNLLWWALHNVLRLRGGIRHSYDPGQGFLTAGVARVLPANCHHFTVGAISDQVTAVGLAYALHLMNCPHLSRWYWLASMCLAVTYLWNSLTEDRRLRNWQDAQIEADNITTLNRRS